MSIKMNSRTHVAGIIIGMLLSLSLYFLVLRRIDEISILSKSLILLLLQSVTIIICQAVKR